MYCEEEKNPILLFVMSNGAVFAFVDSQSCRTEDKALETLRGEILGWGTTGGQPHGLES